MKTDLEAKFDTIREVAIEHASSQDVGSCRCGHTNSTHEGNWGRCTGQHGSQWCDCPRFRGLNKGKQRLLERFGLALLQRLEETK